MVKLIVKEACFKIPIIKTREKFSTIVKDKTFHWTI